jgi:rhodanese-related sulfurtransferase
MTSPRLRPHALLLLLVLPFTLAGCDGFSGSRDSDTRPTISGRLEAGLRVLTFDPAATSQRFTIYVQDFQRRLGELLPHKQDPVLVYCASGNRSTVAAKLLVDAGFVQVANLRRGISEWSREGLPTVK